MDEKRHKAWRELEPTGPSFDLREMGPIRECVCGNSLYKVLCSFDEYGCIEMYLLEAECAVCGSILICPTEIDNKEE